MEKGRIKNESTRKQKTKEGPENKQQGLENTGKYK